ncbi:LacI family DNA-binding transcriptional regulator [Rhizobium sp. AQ_MP]|uniref:LacI family DNA-binding transcriptional regulator n=1 Tax=Rhizobium sp. AQ_MP TaxID=2761536 RepID=UPI00163B5119|nr:LacI family DNA-binding transcriptional regulator [Rhizobium sp. AQ_MP]MBC2774569.1 LacI family DNA-binding transcriptional regulator [Rhizobium sp. AQ_MP]
MQRTSVRTTSFDVAALAGVSQSAVSRAFTPGSSIKETTRQKILEAARKLNYVPNSIASSLTTNRSNMVALILGNLHNPFYVHVLESFSFDLQRIGRQALTFALGDGISTDDAIMKVLQYQVEAVILTSAQLSTRMVNLCQDRGIPVALFNRYIPYSGAYGVRCDNVGGGRMIAEAFLAAGAKTFMMITGDPTGTTSQDRVRGFTERLLEEGIRRDQIVEYAGGSTYEGGGAAIDRHVSSGRAMPDAIFGIADIMAMGAMDTLRLRYGQRVPEDVMVAGFDGIPESGRPPYQLTTVCQPLNAMVTETIKLLQLEKSEKEFLPSQDLAFPGEMMWRSTIPRPAEEPTG